MAADRIDYAETDDLTLEPLRLVQNLFGGGDVQRNRLAIADLEVQAADLMRRREEVATALTREVVDQVLQYEQVGRQLGLLDTQIVTQRHQQAVMEVGYRMGQGNTNTMLSVWQRTADLEARRDEMGFTQARIVAELEQLTGAVGDAWVDSDSGSPEFRDSAPLHEPWHSGGDEVLRHPPISQPMAQGVPDGAETWSVVRVADGDTITAQRGGQEQRVRFACIDAV
ncbi:hypothetical protein [Phormidium sp. FACHB-1136]|uniref:hypothetical protein n=1 Tax=Phormidium sp. FACHB-1136 TaxID=2692848 RepID=UPI00168291FB|nr:hypothetical protein [Phormidium sp. FACHB-1136]MBD2425538.1 hypothetical protein [Phormidium sp. FACHB-1136]